MDRRMQYSLSPPYNDSFDITNCTGQIPASTVFPADTSTTQFERETIPLFVRRSSNHVASGSVQPSFSNRNRLPIASMVFPADTSTTQFERETIPLFARRSSNLVPSGLIEPSFNNPDSSPQTDENFPCGISDNGLTYHPVHSQIAASMPRGNQTVVDAYARNVQLTSRTNSEGHFLLSATNTNNIRGLGQRPEISDVLPTPYENNNVTSSFRRNHRIGEPCASIVHEEKSPPCTSVYPRKSVFQPGTGDFQTASNVCENSQSPVEDVAITTLARLERQIQLNRYGTSSFKEGKKDERQEKGFQNNTVSSGTATSNAVLDNSEVDPSATVAQRSYNSHFRSQEAYNSGVNNSSLMFSSKHYYSKNVGFAAQEACIIKKTELMVANNAFYSNTLGHSYQSESFSKTSVHIHTTETYPVDVNMSAEDAGGAGVATCLPTSARFGATNISGFSSTSTQNCTLSTSNYNSYRTPYVNPMHTSFQGKYCAFCKNNKELPSFYTSHKLRDQYGNITCPVLYKYTCPICGATGNKAHTVSYCKMNPKKHLFNYKW